jgi:hypothetical protein
LSRELRRLWRNIPYPYIILKKHLATAHAAITKKKQALELKKHIAAQVNPLTGYSECLSLRFLRQQQLFSRYRKYYQ